MNTIQTVRTIENDFVNERGPFSDVTFPEERLMETIAPTTMEKRLRVASMFCMFDYNRDANQLVDNLIDLYYSPGRGLYYPNKLSGGRGEVVDFFEEIGFRYPNRDAATLQKNYDILLEKYNGRWSELLLSVSCDAPTLVERLNSDDFNCLKGVKIAPMYARIIDDEVCDLSGVWDLDIPVDTHIRRLSQDLLQIPDASDDRIREEWRGLAIEADISRHVVDGALWHIGNQWDEWGEDYWQKI